MSEILLNAELRNPAVKSASALRREGKVPGIFYAHGESNLNIAVDGPGLNPLIYTSETNIVTLKMGDAATKRCILRDVQFDPVSDRAIHFDLLGLKEDEEITIEVPIVLTGGIPKGVRDGGMLQHIVHKLRVSCLPKYIPGKVEINVGEMNINDIVHIRDLKLENVNVLDNASGAVVAVLPPAVEKAADETATAEAAPAEPEVLSKGKKAEEGEEGAAEAKK
jgi:large subunit ribosomal protein L25